MPTTPAESHIDIGLHTGHISLYQPEQSSLDFPVAPIFSDNRSHHRHLRERLPRGRVQAGVTPHRLLPGKACDGHSCARDYSIGCTFSQSGAT